MIPSDEGDEDLYEFLKNLFGEADEDIEIEEIEILDNQIFDRNWWMEAAKLPEEPEHPEAKFWREVAEEYEKENVLHNKFELLLILKLWETGGLSALGRRGMWN